MEKLITLRFQARCKSCGGVIPAGENAVWLGKGLGTKHKMCSVKLEPEAPKSDTPNQHTFTIDYAELRERYLEICERPNGAFKDRRNADIGAFLKSMWSDDWSGSTMEEMADFIRQGYRVEGLEGVSSLIPARPRRKLRFSEEGDELHLDLVWSGDDTPFSEWEKRVSKPGLSVEIYSTFSASFPAKTIAQFQRWVARALQTLDENGVDMEVNIVSPMRATLFSDERATATKTKVRVRKAGEASDFSNWSAMFSPGGFRHLTFVALADHADKSGKQVSHGLGMPDAYGSWEVAFDSERNVIVFGNSNTERDFPEFEMTEKLRAVLSKLNG